MKDSRYENQIHSPEQFVDELRFLGGEEDFRLRPEDLEDLYAYADLDSSYDKYKSSGAPRRSDAKRGKTGGRGSHEAQKRNAKGEEGFGLGALMSSRGDRRERAERMSASAEKVAGRPQTRSAEQSFVSKDVERVAGRPQTRSAEQSFVSKDVENVPERPQTRSAEQSFVSKDVENVPERPFVSETVERIISRPAGQKRKQGDVSKTVEKQDALPKLSERPIVVPKRTDLKPAKSLETVRRGELKQSGITSISKAAESGTALPKLSGRPVIVPKSAEKPLSVPKFVEEPVVVTKAVEEPVIVTKTVEEPVIDRKIVEKPAEKAEFVQEQLFMAELFGETEAQPETPEEKEALPGTEEISEEKIEEKTEEISEEKTEAAEAAEAEDNEEPEEKELPSPKKVEKPVIPPLPLERLGKEPELPPKPTARIKDLPDALEDEQEERADEAGSEEAGKAEAPAAEELEKTEEVKAEALEKTEEVKAEEPEKTEEVKAEELEKAEEVKAEEPEKTEEAGKAEEPAELSQPVRENAAEPEAHEAGDGAPTQEGTKKAGFAAAVLKLKAAAKQSKAGKEEMSKEFEINSAAEAMPEAEEKEAKKENKVIKKLLTGLGKTLLILLETALLLVGAVYGLLYVMTKGPSQTLRDQLVMSVRETSAIGFIANIFFTDEEIAQIEAESSSTEYIVLPEATEVQINTEKTDGADAWGLVDEDGDGIIVQRITGEGYNGYMMVVLDPSRVIMGSKPEDFLHRGYTVAEMVEQFGAVAGINAGGFYDPDGQGDGSLPDSVVVVDGEIYCRENGMGHGFVGIDYDNILHTGDFTLQDVVDRNIRWGVCFGPVLIQNGVPVDPSTLASGVNPRTAIGQRSDGAILMLVIDGRQVMSLGAKYSDLMEIMLEYGAVNACNLDGGSSTLMWFEGDYINNCASVVGIRPVPSTFLVMPEGVN